MFCTKCGKELENGARFCTSCGNAVDAKKQGGGAALNKNIIVIAGMVVGFFVILGIVMMIAKRPSKEENISAASESENSIILPTADEPEIEPEREIAPDFKDGIAVGDVVTLGVYEQDGVLDNGAEPIKWDVIAQQGGKYLLLSHHVLDYLPYDNGMANDSFHANQTARDSFCTWEESTIRSWLNGEFYSTAFLPEEQEYIRKANNVNKDWYEFDTGRLDAYMPEGARGGVGGGDTVDNVFLLSFDEVAACFDIYDASMPYKSLCPGAMASPTQYAMDQIPIDPDTGRPVYGVFSSFSDIHHLLELDEDGYDQSGRVVLWNDYFYGNVHRDHIAEGVLSSWMLRSPGCYEDASSCLVIISSLINTFTTKNIEVGADEVAPPGGIRPAIWVEVN